jgi:hypothetical protein
MLPVLDDLWRDLRHAGGALRRSPISALTAMLSLAIGVGATTTIFTVINAVLFRRVHRRSPTSSCRRREPRPGRTCPISSTLPTANLAERTDIVTLPDDTTRTVVTSDPGRGLITGDAREFGRFDVPTLFGISRTAPYFHDSGAATLEDVIRHYQALFQVLTFFADGGLFGPPANGQGCNAGACRYRPLCDEEVPGLLAYLRKQ